ncbi:MAG: YggS family pyridoxal phosphate-dependent enzyme [Pirellulales bacterium]
MSETPDRIAENLSRINERIDAAATMSGRTARDVTLVVVTKYVGLEEARAVIAAGCRQLGESRPQSLWQKTESLSDPQVQWHLVGHLQRNKVRRTLPLVHLIHSVDSPRLLKAIDDEATQLGRRCAVLLEVNVSGDVEKQGLQPEELLPLVERMPGYPHVELRGLMTMASRTGGTDVARRNFAELRELRDRLRPSVPEGASLDELSMGMSGDFEEAIREGATIVRVGSAVFERMTS